MRSRYGSSPPHRGCPSARVRPMSRSPNVATLNQSPYSSHSGIDRTLSQLANVRIELSPAGRKLPVLGILPAMAVVDPEVPIANGSYRGARCRIEQPTDQGARSTARKPDRRFHPSRRSDSNGAGTARKLSMGALHQAGWNRREQTASDWLRRKPCRRGQTRCNHDRKYDREDKEVAPAHNRNGSKAKSKSPHSDAHDRQGLCRKAT